LASPSFGTRLKAEREGRGFTLVQIAESTKIPVALLQGLERNDLSRWPKGLYRRAFFRSYVTALGLRAEPLVLEFARLFPDDVDAVANPDECSPVETETAVVPPLALSWAGPPAKRHFLHSGVIALAEVVAVATVGSVIAWVGGLRTLEAIAVVALVYLPGIRLAGGSSRWLQLGRRGTPIPRRVIETATSLPAVSTLESSEQTTRSSRSTLERWRPALAGVANAASVARPVVQRTGRLLQVGASATGRVSKRGANATSALLMRGGRAAGVSCAVIGRATRRVSARAFAVASHAFWKGVRSAAEHAELLASRQLNRRVVDPPAD
jgi:transcriptional regulator with XRE-family HTH domain